MTHHYVNVRADPKPGPAQPTNDPTLATGTYVNVPPQKEKTSLAREKKIKGNAVLESKKASQQGLKMDETSTKFLDHKKLAEGVVYETID